MNDHPPEYRPSGQDTGAGEGVPYMVFEVRHSVLRIFLAQHLGDARIVKAQWEQGDYGQFPGRRRELPGSVCKSCVICPLPTG